MRATSRRPDYTTGAVLMALLLSATTTYAGIAAEMTIFQSFITEHGSTIKISSAGIILVAFVLGRVETIRRMQILRQALVFLRNLGVFVCVLVFSSPIIISILQNL